MNAQQVAERSVVYVLEDAAAPVTGETFDLLATAPQGVAKLRDLILSLAVTGRLVSHDRNDEPASNLLKRIDAEKRRQVELGELSPRALRHASAKLNTPPAPKNWAWSSLAQIGVINPRNMAPDTTLVSFAPMTGVPISMLDCLQAEQREWADIKSGFTHFAEGDVGVAKITPCFQNGKSVVFRGLTNGIGAGTTELHVVRPLCGIVPEYILVFLKSPAFLRDGEAEMTGTAGQKRLPRAYFEKTPFPLPPLAEQRRIVARVEELMGLCDELEACGRLQDEQHARLVATLFDALVASASPEELADNWQRVASHFDLLLDRPETVDALEQTILQLAVRGLLVSQDSDDEPASKSLARIADARGRLVADGAIKQHKPGGAIAQGDKPFELPAGWAWARLADLVAILNGRAYAKDELLDNGVPVLRVGNLFTSSHWYYSTLSLEPDKYCDVGDLLFAWSASFGPFIWPGPKVIYHYHIWKLNLHSDTDLDKLYLYTFLLKKTQEIKAAGHGVSMLHMTKEKMERIVVPLPPLAEQRRIVARVEELRGLCVDLRQRLQQAQVTQSNLADALVARSAA